MDSHSTKILIRNLKKELEEVKRENAKMKWSIKFTRINELECERDNVLEETVRLRALLEDEMGRRVNVRM